MERAGEGLRARGAERRSVDTSDCCIHPDSYDSGVDIFPAEMCVRFSYSKSPGVEITAPAGATLLTDPVLIELLCGS
jgi:hypothetical protein